MRSSGVLDDGLNVDGSYGRIYLDRLFQNSIKLLVVKIAPDRTTNAMNQREFCVTQSGTISSGGMYGTNITDSYGRIRSIDYSKFFQNYWWLRSPSSYRSLSDDGTYWEEITNIAFYLYNGGDCSDGFYVGGRVARSYGRTISPDAFMYYNYTSFYIMEDGSMITYAVEYSYGK